MRPRRQFGHHAAKILVFLDLGAHDIGQDRALARRHRAKRRAAAVSSQLVSIPNISVVCVRIAAIWSLCPGVWSECVKSGIANGSRLRRPD